MSKSETNGNSQGPKDRNAVAKLRLVSNPGSSVSRTHVGFSMGGEDHEEADGNKKGDARGRMAKYAKQSQFAGQNKAETASL